MLGRVGCEMRVLLLLRNEATSSARKLGLHSTGDCLRLASDMSVSCGECKRIEDCVFQISNYGMIC
jgi:hypothetical protein